MRHAGATGILFRWAAVLAVGAATSGAQAAEYTWTGGGGDSLWRNPANWGGAGAPTTSVDYAYFNSQAAAPYTVEFDRNTTNSRTYVRQDNVALDLNGFTNSMSLLYAADGGSQTGTLHVAGGGMLNPTTTYFGSAINTEGTIVVSGSNTTYKTGTMGIGRSDNCLGIFRLVDGARADITSLYPGHEKTGVGKVIVSNATIAASYFRLGYVATARGEMLLTGPDARWLNIGSPEAMVGYMGQGELTVENGAKATHGPQYFTIGKETTATGVVTVTGTGSIIGGPEGESYVRSVTLGGLTKGTVADPPAPGGIGTLNLLNGGALQGAGIGTASYFFIGAGSRIRIRDGWIKWCVDAAYTVRNQPFLFSPGSFYRVELTQNSADFTAATPLIWAGADLAGATRTNRIEQANLEVALVGGFTPEPHDEFRIFRYTGDLEGTFAGLPDAGEFFVQGVRFRIDYGNRTDDAITLSVLPPSGTLIRLR